MTKEFKIKIDWLLMFIILLPTFYVFGKDLRHIQANFFQLSIIAMLGFYHINKWIGAFLLFALFQLLYFPESKNSAFMVQNIFMGALLYHFIVHYAKDVKKYFWAFAGILVFNSFWCALQMTGSDPLFVMANYDIQQTITEYSGFFTLPAFWGNFVAVVSPICFALNPLFIIFGLIAIFMSKSTFSAVAFVCGILFLLWFKKRILFWILGLVLVVAGSFYILKYDMPSGQFEKRFVIWNLVVQKALQKQFFGHGIGSFGKNNVFVEMEPSGSKARVTSKRELLLFVLTEPKVLANKEIMEHVKSVNPDDWDESKLRDLMIKHGTNFYIWAHPHSEVVKVFFEMGLLGLFIVFGYFFDLFRRFKVCSKNQFLVALAGSTIAIFIVCLGHFPFYLARLAGPFLVVLALFELEILRQENA